MPHGNAAVERGERGDHGGRGIPLDEDGVRLSLLKRCVEPFHRLGREPGECLIGLHEIKVEVWRNAECPQHLIEHLPVLTCRTNDRLGAVRAGAELTDDGRHLDGLGPRPEDDHDPGTAQ